MLVFQKRKKKKIEIKVHGFLAFHLIIGHLALSKQCGKFWECHVCEKKKNVCEGFLARVNKLIGL